MQFVSKAIVPPFRDGTKCLVRELCLHLEGFEAHVLGAGHALPELGCSARVHSVYGDSSHYAPTLLSNLRAFGWLLTSTTPDLFHFVFSPNARTSTALRLIRDWTGVPCVQTVASAPRGFERPDQLLPGDIVVTQSEHTARRIREAFAVAELAAPPLSVIPPPAPVLTTDPFARSAKARATLGLPAEGPLFVYPGDLEVSRGAAFTRELAQSASGPLGKATFLIAYRRKTERVDEHLAELQAGAPPNLLFRAEVEDMHALLAAATAVVFPVDDLYGKVDLPVVLLEALSLGVPVLVLDQGPLSELEGASRLPGAPQAWLDLLAAILENPALRAELGANGPPAVLANYAAVRIAARYAEVYRRLLLPAAGC